MVVVLKRRCLNTPTYSFINTTLIINIIYFLLNTCLGTFLVGYYKNKTCNFSVTVLFPRVFLPLANRLEKSVSERLNGPSLALLSHDRWFLEERSWKELTIRPLSSRLLFFCKNPKWSQHGDAGGCGTFPNILPALFSSSLLYCSTDPRSERGGNCTDRGFNL